MMKVTKTTFNMIAANRAAANKDVVMIQRMRKNGTWGKVMEYKRLRKSETDEQVVERLINNNHVQFRLAQ